MLGQVGEAGTRLVHMMDFFAQAPQRMVQVTRHDPYRQAADEEHEEGVDQAVDGVAYRHEGVPADQSRVADESHR